jgi:acyl-CoA reductase-like NAD-dependent aldehyde dehydrogenase
VNPTTEQPIITVAEGVEADIDRAVAAARRAFDAGSKADFSISFGGFKQSGIGREGGPDAVLPYLESKTVVLRGAPAHLRG